MRKIIALGIMLLFLGMTISSSTGLYLNEQSIKPLSSGNTLYVGGNGTGNYSKIQDAIDDSSDGDTVFVYDDSSPYYENLNVSKSINLIGEDRTTTVVDGNNLIYVVVITADRVNISEFTIRNGYFYGINMVSSYNTIMDNIFSNNYLDVRLDNASNNIVSNNNISNSRIGIFLEYDSNSNVISGNNVSNNENGIEIHASCDNNMISNNNITNNDDGIFIYDSSYRNIVSGNIISLNNDIGIHLNKLGNTIVSDNIISLNNRGISLSYSSNNTISDNIISINNRGITIISYSCNNTISNNNITNNEYGVMIRRFSNNNNVFRNIISLNSGYGIYIHYPYYEPCNNNHFYHNNLIDNTQNAYDEYNNTWDNDYPSGGNFWDDYTGNDTDGDGIGDISYLIPGGDNEDRYPLMEPYGNGGENETFFGTLGPICPLLNIAEIKLIDGNESQIQKIEKILNNRILQFIIPYWWGYINVTELDFTITYNKEIPKIPFWLNFYYATILTENENETFIDKPHKVTVKGLNGTFVISRGQLFRFRPPYFLFAGDTYDEVTIELIERGRV